MNQWFNKPRCYSKGFTLLELIIVIIVVGVLASLAIPRMLKLQEGVLAAEAMSNMSAIHKLVQSCAAQFNDYSKCDKFSQINMEYPGNDPNSHFDYAIAGWGSAGYVIGAQYRGGSLVELNPLGSCFSSSVLGGCLPTTIAEGDFISVHYTDTIMQCGFGKFKNLVQRSYADACEAIQRFVVPQLLAKISNGQNL